MNHVQRRIADAGLDPAHVGAEHANPVRELFLRVAALGTELLDTGTEGLAG